MKKRLLVFATLLMMITLLISPNLCIKAASDGLLLWFNKVLPSLLPFMILMNILIGLQAFTRLTELASYFTQKLWHLPGASFLIFIMGLIAGYPMGAKMTKGMLEQHQLTPAEAEKALYFCNNCGPLFIIGTVGTAMLGDSRLGHFLLIIHILSALLMSLILRNYKSPHTYTLLKRHTNSSSSITFSTLFNESVNNAMDTIVCIGGFIIFFSVLTSSIISSKYFSMFFTLPIINKIPLTYAQGIFVGLLELSNGSNFLAKSTDSLFYTLALLSATLSFGGLCVYSQMCYVLGNVTLHTTHYLPFKLLQALISFLLSCTFYPMFSMYTLKTSINWNIFYPIILIILCAISYFFITKHYSKQSTPLPDSILLFETPSSSLKKKSI